MKKVKRVLVFIGLIFASMMTFVGCSCSCSPNLPADPTEPGSDGGGSGGGTLNPGSNPVTYTISVSIDGEGSYISGTGQDIHLEGSSPTYTFSPGMGFGVELIKAGDVTYYTYESNGYSQSSVNITFTNLSENLDVQVKFKQLDFNVIVRIGNGGFSHGDGGTVISSSGSNSHKGGDSPVYTISPHPGYCINLIKLDEVAIFNYYNENHDLAVQDFVIDEQFESIVSDHILYVEFYKLVDVADTLLSDSFYTSNNFLPSTQSDVSSVEFSFVEIDGTLVPEGVGQKVKLEVNELFTLSSLQVSIDGITVVDVPLNSTYYGDGFRFDHHNLTLIFDFITTNIKISTLAMPKDVRLVVYNYDSKQETILENEPYYSYFVIDESLSQGFWYFSLSSNYTEKNVYNTASVTTTEMADGTTLYHFRLDPNVIPLANELQSIVLIYSSTQLIN